jgi:hypothetical protein
MMLLLFSRRYIDRYTVPSKDIRKFLQVLYGFFNTLSNRQKKITPKIRGIDMLPRESLYALCGQNYVLFQDFGPLLPSKVIKLKGSSKTLTPKCRKQIHKMYEVYGSQSRVPNI